MKYMGSKARFAKELIPIVTKNLKPNQWYVEPFVGGANMIDKVIHPLRMGNDFNEYLIALYKALQDGWKPPEFIERETYNTYRTKFNNHTYTDDEKFLVGYFGFAGSYGGRFYEGGYAGKLFKDGIEVRNYPKEAYNNIKKQLPFIKNVVFNDGSYDELDIPPNSIIYCDPPYENTKQYKDSFNHSKFWQWCRIKVKEGNEVYISEYNAPDDFICIWEKETKSSLSANGKSGGSKKSTEKLFVHKSQHKVDDFSDLLF